MNNQKDIKELVEKYSYYWAWFLISIISAITFATIYLYITQKSFEITSTIYIDDKESGGMTTEVTSLEDLGLVNSNSKKSVINEIGVLRSRSLIEKVVNDLDLTITYHEKKELVNYEIDKSEAPFLLSFSVNDMVMRKLDTMFIITRKSNTQFYLSDENERNIQEFGYGEKIKTNFGEIVIDLNENIYSKNGQKIIIVVKPFDLVVSKYHSRIIIEQGNIKSSIITLSIKEKVKAKGINILNSLVKNYNNDAIEYKSLITANTDQFINDRINDISNDLANVDKGVEDFKVKNKLSDMGAESALNLQSNAEVEKRIIELSTQIQIVDFVANHINNNKNELIPTNLGLNDGTANQNANQYNSLLLERNRILKSSSNLNPAVINLDAQLISLRGSIEQSLDNLRSSLTFSLNEARNQSYRYDSKKSSTPLQERQFQDIKRQQQIVESLYLYLLQKREENAIKLGLPVPLAKVIDGANVINESASPKAFLTYLALIVLGIVLTALLILLKSLLDNKVHNREDIEEIVNAPIIGEIPHTNLKNKVVAKNDDMIAESFRKLRTNLSFMLPIQQSSPKSIFITSSLASEGKTFISINLATSIALLGKKVVLIGADIRRPKIHEYLKSDFKYGLTHFLINDKLLFKDVVYSNDEFNFDIIPSGEIPPNPSELLINGRFETLIDECKAKYEYVIVDSSPINPVTDTLLIARNADLVIYVIRANYLDKRMLKNIQDVKKNEYLHNLAILLNDLDIKKASYSYKHYQYGKERKTWLQKLSFNNLFNHIKAN